MTAYFDYAAATPMLPEVVTAMQPYFSDIFYNPSAIYLAANEVKQAVQQARVTIAHELGAKPTEIIFTAGGTEANNLAIHGIASQFNDAHVITSAIEHESVLQPVARYNHTTTPVDASGRVDAIALQDAITDKTVLISIMLANNEIGTVQDIRAISRLINSIRSGRKERGNSTPLYLHTDACQAANYLDIHTARLGVDMMTINAGKVYGPKQTGALFVASGVVLQPLITGGGQERAMRSGTENVANIVGFAEALRIVRSTHPAESKRLQGLQHDIISQLVDNERLWLNGPHKKNRLVNNIHVTIDGYDNERLLMELDDRGILVATGSACSASSGEPSHVLSAIGLTTAQSRSSIRITLGRYSTPEQCAYLIKSIKEVVAKS